jgi:hypothetical protein
VLQSFLELTDPRLVASCVQHLTPRGALVAAVQIGILLHPFDVLIYRVERLVLVEPATVFDGMSPVESPGIAD